jgi:hypothetical protein
VGRDWLFYLSTSFWSVMMIKKITSILSICLLVISTTGFAKQEQVTPQPVFIKPYSLAAKQKGDFSLSVARVRELLIKGNFRIIGEYSPFKDSHVFAITDTNLLTTAAKTKYGIFGAVIRVGIAKVGGEIQVMYNNPTYIGLAYRMKDPLKNIKIKLARILGHVQDFGGEGVEADELPDYNYAFGLEKFGDFYEFAEYLTHKQAVQKVEAGLDSDFKGFRQVYRLDLPGRKQTLFGISMNADVNDIPFLNDEYFMNIADHKELRRLPHLPYEILVDNNRIIGLHAHYRLAISFPDLPMIGRHGFGKLMNLPWQYEEYITRLVGGEWPPSYGD